jgi:hypothetical protein
MFCVYTLRQHPLYTLASLVAYTLLQPLRIPNGARPEKRWQPIFKSVLIRHNWQNSTKWRHFFVQK